MAPPEALALLHDDRALVERIMILRAYQRARDADEHWREQARAANRARLKHAGRESIPAPKGRMADTVRRIRLRRMGR